MREIVFDTETTGLDPGAGHRLVEIGCVEIVNYRPTGKHFHRYLNPERDVPEEVVRVHGLTGEFLADKPKFAEVAVEFQDFIGDSQLVIHNAGFDMKFINAELGWAGFPAVHTSRARDTLQLARTKFPGQPASLDALCRRFGVDNSGREVHGALLDAQLLADVYFYLMGGAQPELFDTSRAAVAAANDVGETARTAPAAVRPPRTFAVPEDEAAAHAAFVDALGEKAIWKKLKEAV